MSIFGTGSIVTDRLSAVLALGLPRPVIAPVWLNVGAAIFIMLADNATFWSRSFGVFEGRTISALVFGVAVGAVVLLVISLFAVRWLQKPVLVFLLILSAVTSYYMDALGVMIDRDMIQNAVTTTVNESRHLITRSMLLHVGLYGVLPALVVAWVKVRRQSFIRGALGWALMSAGSAALCVGLLFSDFRGYSTVLRANKEVLGSVQPLAPLSATLRYATMMMKSSAVVVQATGPDARPGRFLAAASKPVLMVIVAGETARAANWSLSDYGRDTNPELAKRDILYYSKVTSCGTATATSLPCMFSPLTREEYSYEGGLTTENLLDVLARAGFKVEWWDNNTGDKAVAARVPSRFMTAADGAEFCTPECIDGVFLERLQRVADTMTENTVIVLHQIGSHGPSYWLRYPPEREIFAPACKTPELTDCTTEEIVNAYDNTIAYTDYILASVIDRIDATDRVIPAMFYVSDHGESLGEGGVYLHGAPYFIAPAVQTEVPMVIWMSERFSAALGQVPACLKKAVDEPVSHDNMFSTILGMVDVVTTAKTDALDIAAACRRTAG